MLKNYTVKFRNGNIDGIFHNGKQLFEKALNVSTEKKHELFNEGIPDALDTDETKDEVHTDAYKTKDELDADETLDEVDTKETNNELDADETDNMGFEKEIIEVPVGKMNHGAGRKKRKTKRRKVVYSSKKQKKRMGNKTKSKRNVGKR